MVILGEFKLRNTSVHFGQISFSDPVNLLHRKHLCIVHPPLVFYNLLQLNSNIILCVSYISWFCITTPTGCSALSRLMCATFPA